MTAPTIWSNVPYLAPCPACGKDITWVSKLCYTGGKTWVVTEPGYCACGKAT